ncbi:MAG: mechanosensitive ion channel protein MscS [Maribacter sp.]|nr:MAG: mechanosensitive ion channel protein MscS [Maribacter sp.]
METFITDRQNELFATVLTLGILLISKFIITKTVRRVGEISNIVEARTLLITKYVSIMLTLLGVGAFAFIWSINFKDLGLLFSSVFTVMGIALFASWSILSNVTAGVILFFSFPFKIGDRIRISDKDIEAEGPYRIEDIKAFHVNLRKDNGELLVYPNNLMIQKAITLVYNYESSKEPS